MEVDNNVVVVNKDRTLTSCKMSSSWVAVGRAIASETKDPQFESSHRQNLYVLSTVLT